MAKYVYYASAKNGSIDIWRLNLNTQENSVITHEENLERLPIPINSKEGLIYLKKNGIFLMTLLNY